MRRGEAFAHENSGGQDWGANASPLLSVVIAARNAGPEIGPCLAALEGQLRPGVEVLVADGSTDGTPEMIEGRFPWVRVVRGGPGRGLAELRAAGLA